MLSPTYVLTPTQMSMPPPMPTPAPATTPSRVRFQPALRSVAFYSCYIYSPRGNSFVSAASRQLCARLKLGRLDLAPLLCRRRPRASDEERDARRTVQRRRDPRAHTWQRSLVDTSVGRRAARYSVAWCSAWTVSLARYPTPLSRPKVRDRPERGSSHHAKTLRLALGAESFRRATQNYPRRRRYYQGSHNPGRRRATARSPSQMPTSGHSRWFERWGFSLTSVGSSSLVRASLDGQAVMLVASHKDTPFCRLLDIQTISQHRPAFERHERHRVILAASRRSAARSITKCAVAPPISAPAMSSDSQWALCLSRSNAVYPATAP